MEHDNFSPERYQGHIDSTSSQSVEGWAFDRQSSNVGAHLVVLIDGKVTCVASANLPREDVSNLYMTQAHCGFRLSIPPERNVSGNSLSIAIVDVKLADKLSAICEKRDQTSKDQDIFLRDYLEDSTSLDSDQCHFISGVTSDASEANASSQLGKSVNYTLFEITDLIAYLRHHNTVTGIQRTECGFISAIYNISADPDQFRFCSISEHYSSVVIFSHSSIKALIQDVFEGAKTVDELIVAIEEMFKNGVHYRPRRGDNLLILGAYWIIPSIESQLYRMKKLGVTIGTYVYDIIPISNPQWVENITAIVFVEKAPAVISLSDYIITISEYVKNDVARVIKAELGTEKPIGVTPLPHEIISARQSVAVDDEAKSHSDFVLCVGTLEIRKNHILLYRIWAGLIRKYGWDAVPTLVLVGRWGWRMEDLREACARSNNLNGKIVIRSGVHDAELEKLYKHSLFTAFPSFTEGWGLPVGESLFLGKFCVASSTSSVPEVGGDFVDYIDPYDYETSFSVIERAIFDVDYRKARQENIENSFKPRTWKDLASNLLNISHKLAAEAELSASDAIPTPPTLREGKIYDLNSLARSDTASWSEKQVRFAFVDDWHALEPWGAWSAKPRSEIAFRVPFEPELKIRIWLKLSLPNSTPLEQVGIFVDGNYLDLVGSSNTLAPGWYSVDAMIGSERLVSLLICRPRAHAVKELSRELYVGLSGLAYCKVGDVSSECAILRKIASVKWA